MRIYGRDQQGARATSALAAGRELIHQEADVDAVSWQLRLAILKDAKLVLSALS
jgi:hypothetical protein